MPTLPLPDRGTPMDTQVLYDVINAINSISASITTATYRLTTINSPTVGPKEVLTGNARIYGTYWTYRNNSVASGFSVTVDNISLPANFAYAPVVVVTPVIQNAAAGAPQVNVALTNVTTSGVGLKVTFETGGAVDMRVNILAIGIPEGVA